MSRDYSKSPQYRDGRFANPGVNVNKGFGDFLKWQRQGGRRRWPTWRSNEHDFVRRPHLEVDQISTTYINHATHFIQWGGVSLMTDPVFSNRVSPVQWAGPKRHRAPGASIEALGPVDVVAVSHNHYDHMDASSIRELVDTSDPLFVAPLGNEPLLRRYGAHRVVELDWWESHHVEVRGQNLDVTLTPAQHWSARGLRDRNRCLWGGFVFRMAESNVYFAGDTGLGEFFREIPERLGPIALSFVPIGAYEPRWFMRDQHLDPADAVQAHRWLGSKQSVATHFGTFQLTDEGIDEPIDDLRVALRDAELSEHEFVVMDNGETRVFPA